MERLVWLGLLFDFYGELLTPKQRQVCRFHFEEDQSLGEIAQGQGVSRQAVHDLLRRATATLERYEARLGLVARYLKERELLEALAQELEAVQSLLAAGEGTEVSAPAVAEGCARLGAVVARLRGLLD